MRCWALLLVGCLCLSGLRAASVEDLIKGVRESIPPEELADPDSIRFPQDLAKLAATGDQLGLTPSGLVDLDIAVLEAWISVHRGDRAEPVALAVLQKRQPDATQRHRVGLGLVAAWQLQVEDEETAKKMPDPVTRLDGFGTFDKLVRGRCYAVLGQALSAKKDEGYLAAYEQALTLLADADPTERVPVYAQMVVAMEKAKVEPKQIEAVLLKRKDDPAAAEILETLLTSAQKLVGRRAPEMAAPRLDGKDGRVAVADFKGKPLLIYFFASWCKPCEVITPLVVTVADKGELPVLGVSFDNRDTIGNLDAYLTKSGIDFPVIGEKLGWDSEMDEIYHVDAIPHLVLIDRRGVVVNASMIGGDARETAELIVAALAALAKAEAEAVPEPPPEEVPVIP